MGPVDRQSNPFMISVHREINISIVSVHRQINVPGYAGCTCSLVTSVRYHASDLHKGLVKASKQTLSVCTGDALGDG